MWGAVVNKVMKFQTPQNEGNFLTSEKLTVPWSEVKIRIYLCGVFM
jgi:hypothetical protein